VKTLLTALCAIASWATVSIPADAQPVSDDRVKELLAQAAARQPASPLLPASSSSAPAPQLMDLRLDEAVALALERNLDIAVERLNPQAFDLQIAGLRATYKPLFTSTIGQNSIVQLPTNQLVGGQRVENLANTYNFGGLQELPWGGGNLQITFNNRRQESSSNFNTFNPQYNATFLASLTQPLLRDFATDETRTQLKVTAINRDISELQLRSTVTNTLANVRHAYWEYVYQIELQKVGQRSLDLAQKLLDDNEVRVEVGTLAPIDVVQAEAEVATRREALAQIEASTRTAELVLKRLIVSGTEDTRWRARINPVDRPAASAASIDLEAALRTALSKRLDLQEGRRTLEINDLNLRYYSNQRLPTADLVASYGLQGIGGTRCTSLGLGGPILCDQPGGYGDALGLLREMDYPNWNVAVQLSYPVGGGPAEADYARAKITQQQTQAQLRALELDIATEVTNAALQVQSNTERIEAATAARGLAQKRLEAEQSKFEVGLTTNFFVVQAQRDLAEAEINELGARLDHQRALIEFERSQETSLGRVGISLVAAGSGATNARTPGNP
jgi:outer membrane protein